jgi:hypothetical protein
MDYRGVAVTGVWIGMAMIIGVFSFTGSRLADASLILIFVAFVLSAHIIRQKPEGDSIEKLSQEYMDFNKRLSAIEIDVDKIKRLIEE